MMEIKKAVWMHRFFIMAFDLQARIKVFQITTHYTAYEALVIKNILPSALFKHWKHFIQNHIENQSLTE